MDAASFASIDETAVVWFRRDLRLHDHAAVSAALRYRRVLFVFVLDDRLLRGRYASPNRAWFLYECIEALRSSIAQRGGVLLVERGRPEDIVPTIAKSVAASAVFASRDYAPFGSGRDRRVCQALSRESVRFEEFAGNLAVEPEQIQTKTGGFYRVFAPFFKQWSEMPVRAVDPAPERLPPPPLFNGATPQHWEPPRPTTGMLPGGEHAARRRLGDWLDGGSTGYAQARNRLDLDGSSRLSQDLRWGLLSVNEIRHRLAGRGASAFERELAFRDFYHHLAWHEPRVLREPFRTQMAALPWSDDRDPLARWQAGDTGYPVVDAAMRQLVATGWMHNRGRMITASFLMKNLFIDYHEGERFFMRHLVDGDPPVNNGGWQWASSTGADAQPSFRVFNPVLQGKRFDPDGDFVRHWLPQLASVPTRYVHEPWAMPPAAQNNANCIVGHDYPAPIVPLAGAVTRVREFFRRAALENSSVEV